MFQYAAARRVAHVMQTQLKLDLSWFSATAQSRNVREYALGVFRITGSIAGPEEISRLLNRWSNRVVQYIYTKYPMPKLYGCQTHIREKSFHFDPDILRLKGDVYLDGYWQSEMYFRDIQDIVRKEFTFRNESDRNNTGLADLIRSETAVSLHVRRGDYITDTSIHAVHGTCSLDYYRSSIGLMASRVERPYFFIFSDDPEWAKAHLTLSHPVTYVTNNGTDRAYEDMRLMSLCKHHIIANSSFSWWGAWLSAAPDKMVIAPARWFKSGEHNTKDLIPIAWVRL